MTGAHVFTMDGELPQLVITYPECSHCGREVEIEDGAAYCPRCLVAWPRIEDGEIATPDPNDDRSRVACKIGPRKAQEPEYDRDGKHWVRGPYQPCILPSGHEGDHLHPYTVTVTPLAAR